MTSPATAEVLFGLAGAMRLARFDATGIAFFTNSGAAALRSFWAVILILPAYIVMVLVQGDLDQATVSTGLVVAIEAIRYVINCTAFPVAMSYLVPLIGREARYPLFVCAYNWAAPVQLAVILPMVIVVQDFGLPSPVADGLLVGVMLAMTAYQVFIYRVTLLLTWRGAVALALMDMILSTMIGDIATAMELGG